MTSISSRRRARPLHHRSSLLALALIAAFDAQAAEPIKVALNTIQVTATRQEQAVSELLSDVSVIQREELEQAGPSTLLDVLSRQPGIEFSSNGGPGMAGDLRIRGTESKHVLVLVDGQRVGSATLGTVSWSRIPLSQIERVEVLRGPASSLYGSDALGGVVQIFTKRGQGPLAVSGDLSFGSYGTRSLAAGLSGEQNGWRYALGLSDYHTAGFSAVRNPRSSAYNPDADGYHLASVNGSLSYAPAKGHEIGVSFLSNKGRNAYDGGFSAVTAARDYQTETDVYAAKVFMKNAISDTWRSTLSAGRSQDKAVSYTNAVMSSIFNTTQEQWAWQNDIKLPLGNALLAVESLRQSISGTSAFTVSARTINSLLAGWNGNLGAHSLQVNLRRDQNSQFGGRNTGNLAYGYRLDKAWRVHGAYGTAFKAPTFNDLYFPNTPFVGVGNPALQPESSRNAELGLRFDNGRSKASLLYFRNRVENLIQWVETPPGSFFYSPVNVASARIQGWTGSYQRHSGNWTLGANLNLQDPKDTASGKQLNRRARQFGTLTLDHVSGPWTAGAELQAVGARWNDVANTQRMGGYSLVNLHATYAVNKDWSLYARVNNLFGKVYETARDFGVPGSSVFVGVRYNH